MHWTFMLQDAQSARPDSPEAIRSTQPEPQELTQQDLDSLVAIHLRETDTTVLLDMPPLVVQQVCCC